MSNKLASIEKILEIKIHPNADKLEIARILGWDIVVGKNEFRKDDFVIFIPVDSIVPIKPEFEFLRKSSYRKFNDGTEGFRIKTCKLRGQISQGLCLPILENLQIMPPFQEGQDVSSILGIKYYEKPVPVQLRGQVKGQFPFFIPKTDEERVQNIVNLLPEVVGKDLYVTVKLDGTSMTVYHKDGEIGVCSRNLEYVRSEDVTMWRIVKQYDLENKLKRLNKNIALQGELCGESIQKNRLKLKGQDWFLFNVWDIDLQCYWNLYSMLNLIQELDLNMVPLIILDELFDSTKINNWLELAKGNYGGTDNLREGIVVRSAMENRFSDGTRMSFKVLNNDFLLRCEE